MIRASSQDMRTWAEQVCPEEFKYNYTPDGAVKKIEMSSAAEVKVLAYLNAEMGIAKIKQLAQELIDSQQARWEADGSQ
jgi:hypothetical protein